MMADDKTGTQPQATVIGFYGYSNSGKTTLIERLIRDLKAEGYSVAAVKVSTHDISLDEPGKDTWRYAQAGAKTVTLAAMRETGLMVNAPLDLPTILRALEVIQSPQVIIVEGAGDAFVRKIRLGEIEERPNTIWDFDGEYEHLLDKIHQEINKE